MTAQILTQSRLKEILHYCPDTGVFTWKKPHRYSRSKKVGDIAGCLKLTISYIRIRIHGDLYYAHRLAYLYMVGDFPQNEIDHINHNKADNRFCNLRACTRIGNMRNVSKHKTNTSGFTGVCWDKNRRKWMTSIKVRGKTVYLGRFTNKHKAIAVREAAEVMYGFHENHGK